MNSVYSRANSPLALEYQGKLNFCNYFSDFCKFGTLFAHTHTHTHTHTQPTTHPPSIASEKGAKIELFFQKTIPSKERFKYERNNKSFFAQEAAKTPYFQTDFENTQRRFNIYNHFRNKNSADTLFSTIFATEAAPQSLRIAYLGRKRNFIQSKMYMSTISISLTRMTNEVHVQFHASVATLLERLDLSALGLEPLGNLYKQALANEQEALLIVTKSELTALISAQDRARDAIFRGFADTVKGLRNHFDDDARSDANRLWAVFQHYGNIAQKSLDAQTAATNDMLRELKKPEMAQALNALKLSEWVEKLDEENQKFHQLMMQRYNEPVGQTTFRMKSARVETDKFYRAITAHVDNLALLANNDQALNDVMTELNAIVKRFKNILAQQFGKKTGK